VRRVGGLVRGPGHAELGPAELPALQQGRLGRLTVSGRHPEPAWRQAAKRAPSGQRALEQVQRIIRIGEPAG
jgi:hypothetical protein